MIREVIVVEGKDDMAAVKGACQAEVIITNGLGITGQTIELIKTAQQKRGVIILTDPDYPGEKIRRIIDSAVPGCRHAYITQGEDQRKKGKIGVEYASSQEIREALVQAHATDNEILVRFTKEDLVEGGLTGRLNSKEKRFKAGQILGIGQTNAKQFLKRLNAYGITKDDFENALQDLRRQYNESGTS